MISYKNDVDSFVIVSSDSDYWGLISSLPDAHFLVMIEREKCGPDMKEALADSGIFYCYLDDFYSGNSEDIKKNALFKEMYRWIDNSVHLNVNDMFDAAWCAVAFFQLFYRNRKIVKRCSVGINKADLFLDSAYPAAPASFRNYGSIASGACC